jgi:putative membrane protein
MLPGGFLVFASGPLYRTFELAPPVFDISATADQQLAGLIMKVGNLPIIWPILLVLFVKWSRADQSVTPPPPRPAVDVLAGTAPPPGSQGASS